MVVVYHIDMGRVLILGSINTDLVTYVDKLPQKGETVTGGRFAVFAGGKGANQAVAAARAGGDVVMFGAVGDDSYGKERLEGLKAEGIDIGGVVVKSGIHSGVAEIIVDKNGENVIAVAPGANFEFSFSDVNISRARFPYGDLRGDGKSEVDVALFQNELRQVVTEKLIEKVYSLGYCVIWNIAPAFVNPPSPETLKYVHYLVCNEVELGGLFGILHGESNSSNVEEIALELVRHYVKNIVVTLGSKGSILVKNDGTVIRQDSYRVKPIDTVGAGDCFVGVFAASLAYGKELRDALKYSSAAAAVSVTREGAQASMPSSKEISDFLISVS